MKSRTKIVLFIILLLIVVVTGYMAWGFFTCIGCVGLPDELYTSSNLYCVTDDDCTSQRVSCCSCPTPINQKNKVPLNCESQCSPQGSENYDPDCVLKTCDIYCPPTIPRCTGNRCELIGGGRLIISEPKITDQGTLVNGRIHFMNEFNETKTFNIVVEPSLRSSFKNEDLQVSIPSNIITLGPREVIDIPLIFTKQGSSIELAAYILRITVDGELYTEQGFFVGGKLSDGEIYF